MEAGGAATDGKRRLSGGAIIAAIKASGIEYILSVPDITTSSGLLAPIAQNPAFRLLIQHTGFLESINAIRGVAVEYKQPICMMIGLLQHDPDKPPRESPRYGVRIVEPILDDMGIPHHLIGLDADVAKIQPAIEDAYRQSRAVAFLVGRSPS